MGDRLLGRARASATPMPGARRDVRLGVSAGVLMYQEAAHVDRSGD